MSKLYVNKPGGVVVHLADGGSENLYYGDPVDKHGPLADYVDPQTFADPNPRNVGLQQEIDANTRAALTENGQVNSASSAVPGNYRDLEEDAAAQLVRNLERYPNAQAEVVLYEILNCSGRQKVLDAASEYAVVKAHAMIEAAREANAPEPTRPGAEPTLTGDVGDPNIRPDDPEYSARIAERALRLSGKGGQTPAPRAAQRSDLGSTSTDIADDEPENEELRGEIESRHGSEDPDGGEAPNNFNDATKAQLHAYAEQHGVEVGSRDSKETIIEKLEAAGHDSPQTPLE